MFPFQSLVSTVLLVASLEVVVSLELSVSSVSLVLLQRCQGMKLIQLREIDELIGREYKLLNDN